MANLKEIRNRIASVSSTMQITSAMKMVSAAKLKKAQEAITTMRPYSEKLSELILNLTKSLGMNFSNPFFSNRKISKVLLIAITSNRGLCGAFNSNIIKEVNKKIQIEYSNKEVLIITFGKKGDDILSKKNKIKSNNNKIFEEISYKEVSILAEKIMEDFSNGSYDKVELIFNQFKNAATQIIKSETLLPIESNKSKENNSIDYIFEPSQENIVSNLLPSSIKMHLLKALRDSFASEHGARMTAMHKATDNATELRDQLKLSYNKARQASITNEILEIVGGAEALKG
tara:strand:+ start:376 stop:1236 length:861 start_codon:yes stop_codon:yes gene_type:complete